MGGNPPKKDGKKKANREGEILVCRNSKATQRFEIEEKVEAGMVLVGSEVKSLRARKGDLDGAYASVDRGELWLHHMHVGPYGHASSFAHETTRSRKLLVRTEQLRRLHGRLTTKGYTIVPLRVYFKNGYAKVELGVAKGKHAADKREDLKREIELREARSAMSRTRR